MATGETGFADVTDDLIAGQYRALKWVAPLVRRGS